MAAWLAELASMNSFVHRPGTVRENPDPTVRDHEQWHMPSVLHRSVAYMYLLS